MKIHTHIVLHSYSHIFSYISKGLGTLHLHQENKTMHRVIDTIAHPQTVHHELPERSQERNNISTFLAQYRVILCSGRRNCIDCIFVIVRTDVSWSFTLHTHTVRHPREAVRHEVQLIMLVLYLTSGYRRRLFLERLPGVLK